MQVLSLAALTHALSAQRLDAYRTAADADELDGVARYMWNVALCSALQPAIHVLEVTFRNVLYAGSVKVLAGRKMAYADIRSWLDASPTLLMPREHAAVVRAKEQLRKRRHPRPVDAGDLLATLGFGFWTALCDAPYEQTRRAGPRLWPGILKHAFIFAPREVRSRPALMHRVDSIRELRNRISHHEPVWKLDLPAQHARILETLAWMNRTAEGFARAQCRIDRVYGEGPEAFRDHAERIFRGTVSIGVPPIAAVRKLKPAPA
jgi:hypothetical protein